MNSLGGDVVREDGTRGTVEVVDGHPQGHGRLVLESVLSLLHDAVVNPLRDTVILQYHHTITKWHFVQPSS